VNSFLLVLNGATCRFDAQMFEMLQVYVDSFGTSFFSNLTVVVTHWEMSPRANKQRERDGVTQESFQKSWVDSLGNKMDLSVCDQYVPFVFLDNHYVPDDEMEAQIYKDAKNAIFQDACMNPLFPCVSLNAHPEIRQKIKDEANKQGLDQCRNCGRYFTYIAPDLLNKGTTATSTAAFTTQAAIGAARVTRVMAATSLSWDPAVVIKAMSRGWHARTGVHLFGKAAAAGGTVIQLAVGLVRMYKAETKTEKVKAAVGTGAGIAGGFQGATLGATLGTAVLPGIGTVIGGVLGGLVGSVGAQMISEAAIGYLSATADGKVCPICSQNL